MPDLASALRVLAEAARKNSTVVWAYGVLGFAAVGFVITYFLGSGLRPAISVGIVIFLAILIYIVSALIASGTGAALWAGLVLLWTVVTATVASVGLALSAVIISWPCNLAILLELPVTERCRERPDKKAEVAIVRTADFSESVCNGSKRLDILRITDAYFLGSGTSYRAYVRRRGESRAKFFQKFDNGWTPVHPAERVIDNDETELTLNLPVDKGTASVQIVWENAHPTGVGGVGFLPKEHTLTAATVEVILPKGAVLERKSFQPLEISHKCAWTAEKTAKCSGLLLPPGNPLIVDFRISWPECKP